MYVLLKSSFYISTLGGLVYALLPSNIFYLLLHDRFNCVRKDLVSVITIFVYVF